MRNRNKKSCVERTREFNSPGMFKPDFQDSGDSFKPLIQPKTDYQDQIVQRQKNSTFMRSNKGINPIEEVVIDNTVAKWNMIQADCNAIELSYTDSTDLFAIVPVRLNGKEVSALEYGQVITGQFGSIEVASDGLGNDIVLNLYRGCEPGTQPIKEQDRYLPKNELKPAVLHNNVLFGYDIDYLIGERLRVIRSSADRLWVDNKSAQALFAPSINVITVLGAPTVILAANPARIGYKLRVDPNALSDVYVTFDGTPPVFGVTGSHYQPGDQIIDDCCPLAVTAIDDGLNIVNFSGVVFS